MAKKDHAVTRAAVAVVFIAKAQLVAFGLTVLCLMLSSSSGGIGWAGIGLLVGAVFWVLGAAWLVSCVVYMLTSLGVDNNSDKRVAAFSVLAVASMIIIWPIYQYVSH